MASTRTTFTIDEQLAKRARELGINLSSAAREGVANAVRLALVESDREAYHQKPEAPDRFWQDAEAWGDE